jgi:predicted Zn-dependent protease
VIEKVNITRKLGDEQWAFLEQVGLAALDVGNVDLAGLCISRLDIRFPGSGRVLTMRGMLLETQGEFSKAYKLYDDMLASDESNLPVVKRMVAVLRCMENNKEGTTGVVAATKALNRYLDTYYNDAEGWQELVSLYLEQNM